MRAGAAISVSEDGIQPQAGQRWTIYTASRSMPYQTSICEGTSVMTLAPRPSAGAAALSPLP